ncbi:MAG: hypothetical protein Q9164_004823 [Protoblastenia rupestris]
MERDLGKELIEWYGKLSTRRVDLIGDYAGNELFLVEGDSLLLRCLNDPELDFDGQLVHAASHLSLFRSSKTKVIEKDRAIWLGPLAHTTEKRSFKLALLRP